MGELDYRSAREYVKHEHYYGREVRILFVIGGLVMLGSLPLFAPLLSGKIYLSLFTIVCITFLAGLTNPLSRLTMFLDTAIAAIAGVIFEYEAVTFYMSAHGSLEWWFFGVNQFLAVTFFFALYFASKTLRGALFATHPTS